MDKSNSMKEKTIKMMQMGESIVGSVVEKGSSNLANSGDVQTDKGLKVEESTLQSKDKILATAEKYQQMKATGSYVLAKHKNNTEAAKRIKQTKRETKKAFNDTSLVQKSKEGKPLTNAEKKTLKDSKKRMKRFNKQVKKDEHRLAGAKSSSDFQKIQSKKRKKLEHIENVKQLTNYGNGEGQGTGVEENLQSFEKGTVSWAAKGIVNNTKDIASFVRKSKLEHQKPPKKEKSKPDNKAKKKESKHEKKQNKRAKKARDNKKLTEEEKHKLQKKSLQKKNARKVFKGNTPATKFKAMLKNKNVKATILGVGGPLLSIIGIIVIFFLLLSAIANVVGGVAQHTSYQAEDETLLLSNKEVVVEEKADKSAINNVETNHPTASDGGGFDEYKFLLNGTETTKDVLTSKLVHDGNLIASYLTAKYHDYTLTDSIKTELKQLYEEAFTLRQYESIEQRTGTYYDEDSGTTYYWNGSSYQTTACTYRYAIYYTSLDTIDLDSVLRSHLDNEEQLRYYELYKSTSGQKDYLFGGYSARDDIYRYEYDPEEYKAIYGEANIMFSDAEAQQIYNVAQTQLGRAYKWGGSNVVDGFDCSGFVWWVMNTSGVASFPRSTANVILETYCNRISPSDAKPGDLIFFEGTYDTYGASHVGIYLGDGQMIHCGDPIKITNINTNYWTTHFYTYGRIKDEYR